MNVFLDSIGCRLNQSEIERMACQFRQLGHRLVATPEESDLVVINTCTVTAAGASDSRSRARQAHRRNPQAQIVLTGCWSSLEAEQARTLPGVVRIVPNHLKDQLVAHLLNMQAEGLDREPMARQPIPGTRMKTRAFIKAQEGCDNRCAYCVATIARGRASSTPPEIVLRDVRSAVAGGVKEAVLTGVQLSAYGQDFSDGTDLTTLVHEVLAKTEIPRLRLSSLEPWGLPGDFFELWQDPRLCRHLHLPLQSGCRETLRRMARPIQPEAYAGLVSRARAAIPDLAVTTDVIVGFPGETAREFDESLSFIQHMQFSGAHVFVFSPRPGTPAWQFPGRIPSPLARARSRKVRQAVAHSANAFRSRFVGQTLDVLWETTTKAPGNGGKLTGLSDNYLRVSALASESLQNRICSVNILQVKDQALIGKLASEGAA
ncbi:MAG: MiaB/RimO family radical SAM methylthiotransferase [Anaerolineales bacterium]|jgi:threonylcarbamoyladenosine tRNA methylthiotransferase MtaB